MATSDQDDALQYLLSKLKSEDGWSCANLAWNEDRLTVIADQFSSFDGTVKSKILLSFLAMTPRIIHACRDEMMKLLRLARRDRDEWVRLFAAVLGSFPEDQTVSMESDSSASDVLEELGEMLSSTDHSSFSCIPPEHAYLNTTTLTSSSSITRTPQEPNTHFQLKSKPRASSQLRADILQRAETDFSLTGSLVKDRTLHRHNSFSSGSNSFMTSQRPSMSQKAAPIPSLLQRRQREKGTKLLEIGEVPMAGRKKRRVSEVEGHVKAESKKIQLKAPPTPLLKPQLSEAEETEEEEGMEEEERVETPADLLPTPTPDYAAGLGMDDSSIQPHTPSLYDSNFGRKSSESAFKLPSTPTTPAAISTPTTTKHPSSLPLFKAPSQPPTTTATTTPTPATPSQNTPSQPQQSSSTESILQQAIISRQSIAAAQEVIKHQVAHHKQLIEKLQEHIQLHQNQQQTPQSQQTQQQLQQQIQQQQLQIQQQRLQQLQQLQRFQAQQRLQQQQQSQLHSQQQQLQSQQLQQQLIQQRQQQLAAQKQQQQQQAGTQTPQPATTPAATTPAAAAQAKQPSKGLKLTRQQLVIAQEIFQESPQLNKQQRALILAFMAGSRDNPLPGHDVVTIKLNQRQQQEVVNTAEGERVRNIQLETMFEMNYSTGQWRKLQVKRPMTSSS